MNKNIEIIEYNNKKIIYSDYSNLGGNQFLDYVRSHYSAHRKIFENSNEKFLILTNVENAFANREVMKLLKDSVKHNSPHISKSAVIGIAGVQKLLLNSINLFSKVNSKVCDNREEALKWLTE
ncbi:MAG: hypothetical protein JXR91_14540 [Deltaproteobacteria bacterium]|nr:hypothetical protein [Deltaproteobacteria bacterium]